MLGKKRQKSWEDKAKIVNDSILRCYNDPGFPAKFYENLFFLKPDIKNYFKNTEWGRQEKIIVEALDLLSAFLTDKEDADSRLKLVQTSKALSKKNINVHPHEYYYWIDAMVLSLKYYDNQWKNDYEYYVRECLSFPISFIISRYSI